MAKAEKLLASRLQPGGLYDPVNMPLLHHINQALRAHTLFHIDVEYMVKDGGVVIVDEFTGRLMPGRRWSDGLHQAVEAKEHNTNHPEVKIERENQTLATVTFQNYFRKYGKLSGMTGTADTEAEEFAKIYKLDVMVIPTNRVLRRIEEPDTVYRTEREKYEAIVTDILEKQKEGRPVLVGTVSIEKSERLVEAAEAPRHQARRAEREVSRAGSGDRRPGRTQGDRDDRHQHGRPRHRHPARRQPRIHGPPADAGRGDRGAAAQSGGEVRRRRRVRLLLPHRQLLSRSAPGLRADLQRADKRRPTPSTSDVVEHRRAAHHRDRAPRGAPHRQPAARPRRPSGRSGLLALLPLARRRSDADLRVRPDLRPDAAAGHGRGRADRAQDGDQRHRPRPEAGRSAELRRPQAPPRIRRRDEQAARERLCAAPRAARGQDPPHRGGGRRHARIPRWRSRRNCSKAPSTATPGRRSIRRSAISTRLRTAVSEIYGLDPEELDAHRPRRPVGRRHDRRALGGRAQALREQGRADPDSRSCGASSATSCSRSSTRSGRITSTASTT